MNSGHSLTQTLKRFEHEWMSAPPAEIESHLIDVPVERRRTVLTELVCVDLEYRWRRRCALEATVPLPTSPSTSTSTSTSGVAKPGEPGEELPIPTLLVEDYLAKFPELGTAASVGVLLIEEEFRVRHRWGDKPGIAGVVARFPTRADELEASLNNIVLEVGSTLRLSVAGEASIGVDELLGRIAASRLHSAESLQQIGPRLEDAGPFANGADAGDWLVNTGLVTAGQLRLLLNGLSCPLVLGGYVILDEIGSGGMGQVYKALHVGMNREVALKTLKSSQPVTSDSLQRFQREVHMAARLVHPNVVVAHDAGEVDGVRYLVMEYVEGQTLGELVRNEGPQSVGRMVDIILQAAEGLKYAHQRNVIHRDVKPGNLLLTNDGVVKVLDLGLARLNEASDEPSSVPSEPITGAGMVMGTADYMAPEQALETRTADERADIYSLGCTLYFLLTGERVFPGQTVLQTLSDHLTKPAPSLRDTRHDLPASLDAVYKKMLARNLSERHQSMQEVIEALTPFAITADADTKHRSRSASHDDQGSTAGKFATASLEQRESGADASSPSRIAPGRSRGWRRHTVYALGTLVLSVVGWLAIANLQPWNEASSDHLETAKPASLETIASQRDELVEAIWKTPDRNERQSLRKKLKLLRSPADALRIEAISRAEVDDATRYDESVSDHLVAVLGSSHVRHWNVVSAVTFTKDSRRLITGSDDGTVVVRDADSGETQRVIEMPSHVRDLSVSPNDDLLVVGLFDGSIELWDTRSWTRTLRKSFDSGYTYRVLFSPDGKWLAVSTLHGLYVENRATGVWQSIAEIKAANSLAFCSSNVLAVVTGTEKKQLTLLDLIVGTVSKTLPGQAGNQLQITCDGSQLVARIGEGSLKVWDTKTWDERLIPMPSEPGALAIHPTDAAIVVAVTGSGRQSPRSISVIDLATASLKQTQSMGTHSHVLSVAFSPDGKRLATGDNAGVISLWDAGTWTRLDPEPEARHADAIHSVAIGHLGDRLGAASEDGRVSLWNLQTGQIVSLEQVGNTRSSAVAFTADGRRLAFFDGRGGVSLLSAVDGIPTGNAMLPLPGNGVFTLALTADETGERLYAGLGTGRVHEVNPFTQSLIREHLMRELSGSVESLALNRDSTELLAVTSPAGSEPRGVVQMFGLNGKARGQPVDSQWSTPGLPPVAFSADEQSVISGDIDNGFLISPVANPNPINPNSVTTNQLTLLKPGSFSIGEFRTKSQSIAVSPLDGTIVTGYSNGSLHIWSPTGQWQRRFRIGPPGGHIDALQFTPDGRYLITANGNGTMYVLKGLPKL